MSRNFTRAILAAKPPLLTNRSAKAQKPPRFRTRRAVGSGAICLDGTPVYDVGAVFGESVLACIINPLENRRGQNTILSKISENRIHTRDYFGRFAVCPIDRRDFRGLDRKDYFRLSIYSLTASISSSLRALAWGCITLPIPKLSFEPSL